MEEGFRQPCPGSKGLGKFSNFSSLLGEAHYPHFADKNIDSPKVTHQLASGLDSKTEPTYGLPWDCCPPHTTQVYQAERRGKGLKSQSGDESQVNE
jgi:hypothetical protein